MRQVLWDRPHVATVLAFALHPPPVCALACAVRILRSATSIFVAAVAVIAVSTALGVGRMQDITALGDLPGGAFGSAALGVAADGSAIVGHSEGDRGREAFRWTRETGMEGLGDVPGGDFRSIAFGVSADGSVVVGSCNSDWGLEAFRWTRERGLQGLGDLPGGDSHSVAHGVSADGSVVVGFANSHEGTVAFRWTRDDGMQGLGGLSDFRPATGFISLASAVSADGSVIVGHALTASR